MGLQIPLAEAKPGQVGTVAATCRDPGDAALLRAMGLKPNCRIRVCRLGEPCIVEVLGCGGSCCRIGLARPLARQVMFSCEGPADGPVMSAVPTTA